jgi:hypothetical protein
VVLPHRVKNATVTEGSELKPVVTDNFLLLPHPEDGSHPYRGVFKAEAGR